MCARERLVDCSSAITGGIILDGGTESGVMAMVGSALRFTPPKTVRIIGVCPKDLVHMPHAQPTADSTPLEPHHSSFMLVPSNEVRVSCDQRAFML
jgi:hypothetical protein